MHDNVLVTSLILQGCTEVLCASGETDVSQRDRWNRTPLTVACGNTREIILNTGQSLHSYYSLCGSAEQGWNSLLV